MEDLISMHRSSIHNRTIIDKSDLCGCFYCLKYFTGSDIREWCDGGDTAICIYCGVDSVIGSASGYSLSSESLTNMNKRWFKSTSILDS